MIRKLTASLVAVLVAATGLTACGGDEEDAASGPATVVPAGYAVYLEATIRPEGEQKENAEALIERIGELPVVGQTLDPEALAESAIADLAAENGIEASYAEDFEPWIGDRVGLAFDFTESWEDPSFVLAIETTDDEVARDSLERLTAADEAQETDAEYEGVSYQVSGTGDYALGVFDGFAVLATNDAFEPAVDASDGDSLGDSDTFADAFDPLAEERLGSAFLDTESLVDQAVAAGEAEQAEVDAVREAVPELLERPFTMGLIAGEASVALEVAAGSNPDAPSLSGGELLGEAPGDAFGAVAIGNLGEQAQAIVDQIEALAATETGGDEPTPDELFEEEVGVPLSEFLGSLDDALLHVRGELPADVVAQLDLGLTGEGDAPERVFDRLREEFEEDSGSQVGPPLDPQQDGFSAEPAQPEDAPAFPRFIDVALADDAATLTAASSREAAEAAPAGTLAESDVFQSATEALGDEFEPIVFADLAPILEAAVGGASLLGLATGDTTPEEAAMTFVADKFSFAAVGVREDEDTMVERIVVGLAE